MSIITKWVASPRPPKLRLFCLAFIIQIFVSVLFVTHGTGIHEHILYFGIPATFLTFYTPEYFLQYESYSTGHLHHPFPLTLDLGLVFIDVVLIWCILVLLYKILFRLTLMYKK